MPVAKRAATMPVEALKQLMVDPVPGIVPGYFIAREALAHIGVAPEMFRGEIEVRDGRPLRGQDHQYDLRRSYGQEFPQLDDYDPIYLPYATTEISPKRREDTHYLEKLGSAKKVERLAHNLLLARRSMLIYEEKQVADLLFSSANWGSNTSTLALLTGGSGAKFGAAGAKEFDDMALAADYASATMDNMRPTDAVIGIEALRKLRGATQLREFIGDSMMRPTDDALVDYIRRATGVERVHVGRARAESARSGAASSEANLWGDSMAFYWRDVSAGPSVNGVSVTGGTAVGIYLNMPGASEGYWAKEIMTDDPPSISMVAGVERTELFLNETDGSTSTAKDPRGFLLTDLV